MTPCIPLAEQQIFVPALHPRCGVFHQIGVVAADHVELFSVFGGNDGMVSVFSTAVGAGQGISICVEAPRRPCCCEFAPVFFR